MAFMSGTIEFLCLGLWLGSDVFLSFVVAPGAFRVLGSRDASGAMVGFALGRMHLLGVICGIVFLLARLFRSLRLAWFVCAPWRPVVLMVWWRLRFQSVVNSWR